MTEENVAMIGHNNPPSPFDEVSQEIEDLFYRASNLGAVESVEKADAAGALANELHAAMKRADALRKEEVQPINDEKAKVQAKYAPLIADTEAQKGKAVLALAEVKNALAPWLRKLEDEKRAAADALRREAEEKQRVAREALQSVQSLEDKARAEALYRDAQKTTAASGRAEKDTAKAGGGTGRAVSLRTKHVAEVEDLAAFARWAWEHCRPEMTAFLAGEAQRQVDLGRRDIPGVIVCDERSVA